MIAVGESSRAAVASGHRTLLWDLAAQGGAGFLLGQDEPRVPRAASIFQRDGKLRQLIEPTAARRAPLGSFAPNVDAARALGRLWHGIEAKLAERKQA